MRNKSAPRQYSGLCIDLIHEIAQRLNFDYEIFEEATFGTFNGNNQWNGVVKKLIDREADIGLGSMSVMADRESVVDFTVPFYDLIGISILIQQKKTSQISQFINVLDEHVWLYFLLLVILTRFDFDAEMP